MHSFNIPLNVPEILPVNPSLPTPKETGWTKRSIDQLGERAANALGCHPGADLVAIVKGLGGRVIYGPVDRTGSTGFLEVSRASDVKFTIALSPYPGHYRNRFTIAHELGHYFLHSRAGEQELYATRQAGSRVEWEANWFAAAFLMPSEHFVREWNQSGGNIGHLIDHFQVSGGAIEIRRDTLRDFGCSLV